MSETEKKGDLLNQLAIISDLIEKVNVDTNNSTVLFEVKEEIYEEIKEYLDTKYDQDIEDEDNGTFSIALGDVVFLFSKNSV
jgi:hypothetical protein